VNRTFPVARGDQAQEGVHRWPISRVLSRRCRGCPFIKDADCSAPQATYPEVTEPDRLECAETHFLLLSLAPDEVYPAGPINQAAGALLPHPFTLTPEAEASLRMTLRRSTLCCTCSVLADGGRYPPSCPVEPGLSSPFKERSEHLAICRQMHPTLANAKFHQRLNACNQTHEVSLRFTNNASINRPTVLRFAGFPDRTASTARTTPVVQCSALSAPRS